MNQSNFFFTCLPRDPGLTMPASGWSDTVVPRGTASGSNGHCGALPNTRSINCPQIRATTLLYPDRQGHFQQSRAPLRHPSGLPGVDQPGKPEIFSLTYFHSRAAYMPCQCLTPDCSNILPPEPVFPAESSNLIKGIHSLVWEHEYCM